MKTALKIFLVMAALFIFAAIIVPTVAWSGGSVATISVRVLDNNSARPVVGAEVSFLRDIERQILSTLTAEEARSSLPSLQGYAVTDSTGSCSVKKMCGAGGGNFLFWRTGKIGIEGLISIRAAGYENADILIQNILGQKEFPLRKKHHSITIHIKKNLPNKALQPTTMPVTFRADARTAPVMVAAEL